MDEAKILELAREAGLCGAEWHIGGLDYQATIIAFALMVAREEMEECADIAAAYEVNGISGIATAIRSRTE